MSKPALGPTLRALSPRVKWPGLVAGDSLPSTTEVKNMWSYTSTPPYILMVWFLINHRDNFSFSKLINHLPKY
jgi:hypothetical protein